VQNRTRQHKSTTANQSTELVEPTGGGNRASLFTRGTGGIGKLRSPGTIGSSVSSPATAYTRLLTVRQIKRDCIEQNIILIIIIIIITIIIIIIIIIIIMIIIKDIYIYK
jgi:hypothetical protein